MTTKILNYDSVKDHNDILVLGGGPSLSLIESPIKTISVLIKLDLSTIFLTKIFLGVGEPLMLLK